MNENQLFILLQVNDALFPIGGYSHSYGLETYIQKNIVNSGETALAFMKSSIKNSFLYSELLPARLAYEYTKEDKLDKIAELEEIVEASKSPVEIRAAAQKLGMSDSQIVWKYKVPEDQTCYDSALDLVGQGCNLIISNSYGHQTYMEEEAEKYPDINFVAMTGDFAAISDLDNFYNAFTAVYQSRYVSGVVAGMKVKELVESGTLTPETQPDSFTADGKVKIGYVGAYNYAEVVSGYTAFFLGVQSVYPDVQMEVMYTNSWFDIDKEGAAAEALIANGAVIIGQHADSTGAPAATQKLKDSGKICYSIGYNIDMLDTAPTAALTSATNVWKVYYKELFEGAQAGSIPQDWCKGYEDGAVAITDLGPEVADGTAEKVAEVEAALKDGSLHVFDTSKFTVDGAEVTTAPIDLTYYDFSTGSPVAVYQGETKEAISDGYFHEGELRAAPTFALRIDGIIEDADPVA